MEKEFKRKEQELMRAKEESKKDKKEEKAEQVMKTEDNNKEKDEGEVLFDEGSHAIGKLRFPDLQRLEKDNCGCCMSDEESEIRVILLIQKRHSLN